MSGLDDEEIGMLFEVIKRNDQKSINIYIIDGVIIRIKRLNWFCRLFRRNKVTFIMFSTDKNFKKSLAAFLQFFR